MSPPSGQGLLCPRHRPRQVAAQTVNEAPPARLLGTCETPQRQTAPHFLPAQWLGKAALRVPDELFSCDTE